MDALLDKINIKIHAEIQILNLNDCMINLMEIHNRRFMYHKSGELILGMEGSISKEKILYSHATEHSMSGSRYPFDQFCRGWIGTSKNYKNGIMHFAPEISAAYVEQYEPAFMFIEKSIMNGFNKNSVLRNFCCYGETKINAVLSA